MALFLFILKNKHNKLQLFELVHSKAQSSLVSRQETYIHVCRIKCIHLVPLDFLHFTCTQLNFVLGLVSFR